MRLPSPLPLSGLLMACLCLSAAAQNIFWIRPEQPYKVSSGWQRLTWTPDSFRISYINNGWNTNDEGAFTFRVYQGQEATMTVTDTGFAGEIIGIYRNDIHETPFGSTQNDLAYSADWVSSPDAALLHPRFSKRTFTLQPGSYALRFSLGSWSETKFDDPATKALFAAFRVDIKETPDGDEDRLADEFETNTGIYVSPVNTGTDPTKADSDGDGINDREEIFITLTNPVKKDTDGDGHTDSAEIATGKDPLDPASKPEAIEIRQAMEVTVNTEIGKNYQVEWSSDLQEWHKFPEIITGDGNPATRFYSTKNHPARYFRSSLVPPAPEP